MRSIRSTLLLAVNMPLILGFGTLLIVDYNRGLADQLLEKHIALEDEAKTLIPAVAALRHHGHDALQQLIDAACARMQETSSPGHHIALEIGDTLLQAQDHHRASPNFPRTMKEALRSPSHEATLDGQPIIVGADTAEDTTVYVSEFIANVKTAAMSQLIFRSAAIGLLGLAVTVLINLLLLNLVTRPTERLVATVRQIGEGHLGIRADSFRTRELKYLSDEISSMSGALAEAQHEQRHQMSKARRIQQHLIPNHALLADLNIHCLHEPADAVGGDFFDATPLDEHRLVVFLADVTGHGVPAAMGAAMLKILFRRALDQTTDVNEILTQINSGFHAASLDEDFATAFIALIDRDSSRLHFASAGHEVGFLMRRNGDTDELKATGIFLGLDPESRWEVKQVTLERNDRLILVTDGFAEAVSPTGTWFGRDTLRQYLLSHRDDPPETLPSTLLKRVIEHTGTNVHTDDMTMVVSVI